MTLPPFTEELLLDEVENVYLQQQFTAIQKMGAAGMTTRDIWAFFAQPQPDPSCAACGLDRPDLSSVERERRLDGCAHGAPRWSRPDGSPIPLRTMQRLIAKVRERWRAERLYNRAAQREQNLASLDLILRGALEAGQGGLALGALRLRTELDGSLVAAEEAARPSLYERVLALAARLQGFDPPAEALVPRAPVGGPAEWRFRLLRLEQLLISCDASAARFRKLGAPPQKESERRQWLARLLAEGAHQRATWPGITPKERFEDVSKAVFTGGVTSDNVVLGELAEEAEKLTEGMKDGGG